MRAALAALGILALAACGSSPTGKSDWELRQESAKPPAETALTLPPYPRRDLVEFEVAAQQEFRFFIDPASVSLAEGRAVRYTLIARSPDGVNNVSYEEMRCPSVEVRLYALGKDGAWSLQPGAWRRIQQSWHAVLHREYFCPLREPIATTKEGVHALRNGGHPLNRGLTGDVPRGF